MSSTSGKRCQSAVRTLGRSPSHVFQILDARFSGKIEGFVALLLGE